MRDNVPVWLLVLTARLMYADGSRDSAPRTLLPGDLCLGERRLGQADEQQPAARAGRPVHLVQRPGALSRVHRLPAARSLLLLPVLP